jgi:predicted AAA+ superfamily ATPase
MSMTKTPTKEEKIAAFKAQDAQDKRERIALDVETLPVLIEKLEAIKTLSVEFEALCGDLVSDVSHHALKAQVTGGLSSQAANVLIVAQQSLDMGQKALAAAEEG